MNTEQNRETQYWNVENVNAHTRTRILYNPMQNVYTEENSVLGKGMTRASVVRSPYMHLHKMNTE